MEEKWCPRCNRNIPDPGTKDLHKFKNFWQDNTCYNCGSKLSITLSPNANATELNSSSELNKPATSKASKKSALKGWWQRLFGKSKPEGLIFKGFVVNVSYAEIVNLEFGTVAKHIDLATKLTVENGQLYRMELMIDGFNSDPRPLDEIPEVQRWVKRVDSIFDDMLYWLTPSAFVWYAICLGPRYAVRLDNELIGMKLEQADIMSKGGAIIERLTKFISIQQVTEMFKKDKGSNFQAAREGKVKYGIDYLVLL